MKPILGKIDKLSIIVVLVVLFGVLSSFLDFGILSVFFSVATPLIFIINSALAIYGIFKKKYFYLVGILLFFFFYNPFFKFPESTDIETKHSISLLTYNIREFKEPNIVNSEQNKIIKFLDSVDADILAIQESSYIEGQKIKGYPYYFLGYRPNISKSLLTIFSKYPIINKGHIDFPESKNNAIYADIKIKQDTIRVYNTHLQSYVIPPNFITNQQKNQNHWNRLNNTITKQVSQAQIVRNHANKSNKKTIICGDFNATPYSQTYRTIKKELNDSYLSNGNGFGATYSLYNYPLRLDYVLNNEKIKVNSHNNFNLNLSDHEPVFVMFNIEK